MTSPHLSSSQSIFHARLEIQTVSNSTTVAAETTEHHDAAASNTGVLAQRQKAKPMPLEQALLEDGTLVEKTHQGSSS
jgi:hypothetical protein